MTVNDLFGEYYYITNKMRCRDIIPSDIIIEENTLDVMIFTLLHEITHTITPYVERKIKDVWINMDHSNIFYDNFLKIIEHAYNNKIINKQYDMKQLRQKDKL